MSAAWLQCAKGASAPLNLRFWPQLISAASALRRWVRMKSPGSRSLASAPGPYGSTLADKWEHLFCKTREDATLGGVRQIHYEVVDAKCGVLPHQTRDVVGVADVRVPCTHKGLVLADPARRVLEDPVDLARIAEDGIELQRLQDRVVVTSDVGAVLAQDPELVSNRVYVGAEVRRVAVLRYKLQGDLLPAPSDPDRWVGLLDRLRLVHRAANPVITAFEGRLVLRPHGLDDLQRLAEHAQALRRLRVVVAVREVFMLVPAGADAE